MPGQADPQNVPNVPTKPNVTGSSPVWRMPESPATAGFFVSGAWRSRRGVNRGVKRTFPEGGDSEAIDASLAGHGGSQNPWGGRQVHHAARDAETGRLLCPVSLG